MSGPRITKYTQLESRWVIRNTVNGGRIRWSLSHEHSEDTAKSYGYVYSYMKLGSYKCNRCGEMAPTQINGFFELCKWNMEM